MSQSVFLIAMEVMEEDMGPYASRWSKDEQIKNAIYSILQSYRDASQRTSLATSIDFSRPEFRSAYLFLYLASHVRIVERCFDRFWHQSSVQAPSLMMEWYTDLRRTGRIRVCAVGGGPGTDLLGFYLFMINNQWPLFMNGTVLDKWYQWVHVFQKISARLDPQGRLQKIQYKSYDFFNKMSEECKQELMSADLVTVVKFISAVAADRFLCNQRLKELIELLKPGSCFFFMDNSGGGYREMTEKIAGDLGLILINRIQFEEFYIPSVESDHMYSYRQRFGLSPQKKAKVAVILWKKPNSTVNHIALTNDTFEDSIPFGWNGGRRQSTLSVYPIPKTALNRR